MYMCECAPTETLYSIWAEDRRAHVMCARTPCIMSFRFMCWMRLRGWFRIIKIVHARTHASIEFMNSPLPLSPPSHRRRNGNHKQPTNWFNLVHLLPVQIYVRSTCGNKCFWGRSFRSRIYCLHLIYGLTPCLMAPAVGCMAAARGGYYNRNTGHVFRHSPLAGPLTLCRRVVVVRRFGKVWCVACESNMFTSNAYPTGAHSKRVFWTHFSILYSTCQSGCSCDVSFCSVVPTWQRPHLDGEPEPPHRTRTPFAVLECACARQTGLQ